MRERYEPPSEFLQALVRDDGPLAIGEFAEANLRRLIAMTRDIHPANRDWATLLLAQQDLDTEEVREALLSAADDEHDGVRAEAILGLAQRDKELALPFLQRELSRDSVALPVFEAACVVADPSLIEDLSAFTEPSGNEMLDQLALEAIEACEAARSP